MTIPLLLLLTCFPVGPEQDQIHGRDLAKAGAPLTALPGDAAFGYAPTPGSVRIFDVAALTRLLRAHGGGAATSEVCFERPVHPLDPAQLLHSLESALPGARVELLDYARTPVPEGTFEFTRNGIGPSTAGAYLWRGAVRYAGAHRHSVWAKVRIAGLTGQPIAASDIAAGQTIQAQDVALRDGGFTRQAPLSPQDVVGAVARVPIRTGTLFTRGLIAPPADVARGQEIAVDVRVGNAEIRFTARAEAAGQTGERIAVRNPTSGRTFRAVVSGPGKAIVE